MTLSELTIIFGFGLLSSLHCLQMCGPLVVSYSLALGDRRARQQWLAHLGYHGGRILTYTTLGGIAGLTGRTLRMVGDLAGFENAVAITTGLLMLMAGLLMLDLIPHGWLERFDLLRLSSRILQPLGRRISSPSPASKFGLGLMMGLLPCGLIYAALIKALSTGEVAGGAATMAAFGLGTATSLLGLGVFSSTFSRRLSRFNAGAWGTRITAISVMLLGAILLYRGVTPLLRFNHPGDPGCHTE
jgi:sulfite exporter TauE/SafE